MGLVQSRPIPYQEVEGETPGACWERQFCGMHNPFKTYTMHYVTVLSTEDTKKGKKIIIIITTLKDPAVEWARKHANAVQSIYPESHRLQESIPEAFSNSRLCRSVHLNSHCCKTGLI